MAKENLETKAKKAILSIEDKVTDIGNILRDVGMKLCHVIEYKIDYTRFHDIAYRSYRNNY